MGITTEESNSWFFITWMTTGVFSIVIALVTRQPASINLSLPVMIFLLGAIQGFTLPQIIGANLVVGLVSVTISVLRLTQYLSKIVPTQVALGVITGNLLSMMVKTTNIGISDAFVSGPIVGGYLLARLLRQGHLVSLITAMGAGVVVILASGTTFENVDAVALPALKLAVIEFDLAAIISLGIPILILTVGIGDVQALAILKSEGYRLNSNLAAMYGGITTAINALFGGHAASLGGGSIVLASGPSAGPMKSRYWAMLLSSLPVVVVALLTVPVIGIVLQLPASFTLVIGAIAIAPSLVLMMKKTVDGPMWIGGVVAVAVATIPLQVAGLSMPFWALLVGSVVTTIVGPRERRRLVFGF